MHVLTDTDGDGLEDKVDVFWSKAGDLLTPVGMLATGEGVYVCARGKVALLRDTGSMDTEALARKHLGVDLTRPAFWEETVDAAIKDVGEFVLCNANAAVLDLKAEQGSFCIPCVAA